jgi:glycosyltransferase involved in cell wall biosynthesis
MMEPLVSVLVPLYNHEKYIEACLASVLNETYRNLELIILDDGSKDRSFALAAAWIEANQGRFTRVKAWTQPNAGICKTVNRLLEQAQGPYITFLASDDALKPGGIQARVAFLEQHPALLAVFGDAEVIDGEGGLLAPSTITDIHHGSRPALANPKRMTKELLLKWSIPGPVLLARKITWDPVAGVGLYNENLTVEDRDFYLRLLARKALGFLDQSVARYRIHGANASRSPAQNAGADSLRDRIIRDIKISEINNLHRFQGLDKATLHLLIKNAGYSQPRKAIRYRLTRNLLKLIQFMNRAWI